MKNFKNKLFEDLKLENAEIVKVIGGKSMTTGCDNDTNISNGGYDIGFDTCNSDGNYIGFDTVNTSSAGTSDKPE